MSKGSTKAKGVPRERQIDLFGPGGGRQQGSARRAAKATRRVFVDPDPEAIYLGNTPLMGYLEQVGLREPLVVRRLLQGQDWSAVGVALRQLGAGPVRAPRDG